MMISTRGRYALRALVDIAEHAGDGYVPIREVAERQGISLKYLERIMPLLTRNGLVVAASGRGGGYRPALAPEKCRIGDILRITEGSLAPVACLQADATACQRSARCSTLAMWEKFGQLADAFFDGITLADLLGANDKD